MDALRGIAMWLGVVLHSVISYQKNPRAGWPLDNSSSIVMDFIYEYLHAFRMPLFFLVAGFFAHFLYKKIGMKPFIIHRAKRILVPFILSIHPPSQTFSVLKLNLLDFSEDLKIRVETQEFCSKMSQFGKISGLPSPSGREFTPLPLV